MRQVSVKALVVSKSIPRWLVTRALSKRFPRLSLGPTAVLRMKDVQEPALPGPDWGQGAHDYEWDLWGLTW